MRLRPFALAMFLVLGCKDPYTPKVVHNNNNFLVVDGFINAGAQTRIRLTRTTQVNDTAAVAAVHGANVTISQGGMVYTLVETGDSGYYTVSTAGMQFTTCKLAIQTSDKRQYASDEIPVLPAGDIDTIQFVQSSSGVQLYLDAHSEAGNYYRFDYDEIWEYHPPYQSLITYDWSKRMLSYRTPDAIDSLYNCYQSASSTDVLIYSTASLGKNEVYHFPIGFIPNGSIKLTDTYSINVKQYALSNAAYNYFAVLRKTTQGLGDVFGPLPSELKSNIHTLNSDDVIIGYMTASDVHYKRIFIKTDQVPGWRHTYDIGSHPTNSMVFPGTEVPLDPQSLYYFEEYAPCPPVPGSNEPAPCSQPYHACCDKARPLYIQSNGNLLFAYDTICIDCMFWGTGGRKKPDYWPN